MDKKLAPKIVKITSLFLQEKFKDIIDNGQIKVVCGMEAAGGANW
jgi:hypothetical protein